jgi:hypothetical protein
MAGKLIELKAAAQQLGITIEQLQELREAGKVHGYKDGASWKFKPEEIAQLVGKLSSGSGLVAEGSGVGDSGSLSAEDFDNLLSVDAESDSDDNLDDSSILISSDAERKHDSESSSTVIGKEKEDLQVASDLRLADDDDEGSDIKAAGSSARHGGDDLKLADSEDLSDEMSLSDDLEFESDDALMLGDGSDLSASDASDQGVLDDSDSSDAAIGAGDSGIGLANPSDSGLSLEEESSSAALELPEDEDMISLADDMGSASDDGNKLQQDEEFLLSPSDEVMGDESSDSGSQVIALDDSGAFDSDADVAIAEGAEPILVPEEVEGLDVQLEPIEEAAAVARATPGLAAAGVGAPEAAYTLWNLMSLVFVVLLLGVTGMLMADVVRNMWSWNSETGVSSGLANTIINALGMK